MGLAPVCGYHGCKPELRPNYPSIAWGPGVRGAGPFWVSQPLPLFGGGGHHSVAIVVSFVGSRQRTIGSLLPRCCQGPQMLKHWFVNVADKKCVYTMFDHINCKVFGRFVAAPSRRAVTLGEGPRRAGWLSPAVSVGQERQEGVLERRCMRRSS